MHFFILQCFAGLHLGKNKLKANFVGQRAWRTQQQQGTEQQQQMEAAQENGPPVETAKDEARGDLVLGLFRRLRPGYLVHFFDPTCGKGMYAKDVPDVSPGDFDVTALGSPIIGLDVCGRKVEGEMKKAKVTDFKGADDDHEEAVIKCSVFTFADKSAKNVTSVKTLSRLWMETKLGWEMQSTEIEEEGGYVREKMVFHKRFPAAPGCVFQMEVRLYVRVLESWDFFSLDPSSPLFSFVDPFGPSQIPSPRLARLIGRDRFLFLNVMVCGLNRNQAKEALHDSVFGGDSSWRDIYRSPYVGGDALTGTARTNAILERLAELYCRVLRNNVPPEPEPGWVLRRDEESPSGFSWIGPPLTRHRLFLYRRVDEDRAFGRTAAVAFRTGTTSPEANTLYYMVLGCQV